MSNTNNSKPVIVNGMEVLTATPQRFAPEKQQKNNTIAAEIQTVKANNVSKPKALSGEKIILEYLDKSILAASQFKEKTIEEEDANKIISQSKKLVDIILEKHPNPPAADKINTKEEKEEGEKTNEKKKTDEDLKELVKEFSKIKINQDDLLRLIYDCEGDYNKFTDSITENEKKNVFSFNVNVENLEEMTIFQCIERLKELEKTIVALERTTLLTYAQEGRIIRKLKLLWDLAVKANEKMPEANIITFIQKRCGGKGFGKSSINAKHRWFDLVEKNPILICLKMPFRQICANFENLEKVNEAYLKKAKERLTPMSP